MKSINTIIIEDEKRDLELMQNLLKNHDEINLIATAEDVENGIAVVAVNKPDLIFLDINLYGRKSFEILDVIHKFDFNPKIIFTTAYDNYMNLAFKYAAFDYLLKPIDRKELSDTILRYIKNEEQTHFSESYKALNHACEKLIFNTLEGFEIVDPKDIVYIETVKGQGYSEIHVSNDEVLLVTKSIGEIETMLPKHDFFRIHRSHIVNLQYVKKVNRIMRKCYLKTDTVEVSIAISKDSIKLLKEKIKEN
jgi:two-component system LytT family response regulator